MIVITPHLARLRPVALLSVYLVSSIRCAQGLSLLTHASQRARRMCFPFQLLTLHPVVPDAGANGDRAEADAALQAREDNDADALMELLADIEDRIEQMLADQAYVHKKLDLLCDIFPTE